MPANQPDAQQYTAFFSQHVGWIVFPAAPWLFLCSVEDLGNFVLKTETLGLSNTSV